jgi:hypothetical protein
MITLEANYSKKLGLPGYSSHQYSLTVRKEVADISQIELFTTLQANVDRDIQQTGFLPDSNGNGYRHNGNGNGNGHRPLEEKWNCSDKQRTLILKIVVESKLDKNESINWPRIDLANRSKRSTSWKHPVSSRSGLKLVLREAGRYECESPREQSRETEPPPTRDANRDGGTAIPFSLRCI